MRNTLKHYALPVALIITLAASTAANASAGGRYHRQAPEPTPTTTPAPTSPKQQAAAEASSKAAWKDLRDQVSDLETQSRQEPGTRAQVPDPKDVQPERRVCEHVAEHGTRIKRRVCRTEREVIARERNNRVLREALLRHRMYQ